LTRLAEFRHDRVREETFMTSLRLVPARAPADEPPPLHQWVTLSPEIGEHAAAIQRQAAKLTQLQGNAATFATLTAARCTLDRMRELIDALEPLVHDAPLAG
jgi:hypothetical protein